LGDIFYGKVGIVRENSQLNEALDEVIAMQISQKEMGISDKNQTNNQNLIDFLEFKNALLLAPTIISAAIARDESRGAHYKVGFENENDAFKQHIVLQWKRED
jgi:succinate dehydrogenase/fumarate reductase flavoprotein subunit